MQFVLQRKTPHPLNVVDEQLLHLLINWFQHYSDLSLINTLQIKGHEKKAFFFLIKKENL